MQQEAKKTRKTRQTKAEKLAAAAIQTPQPEQTASEPETPPQTEERKTNPMLNAGADFSNDGKHRYRLWRIWDEDMPITMCIGLNPSTANSEKNDATIRILIMMLKKLGYGGFYMMNCWAYITSNPKELLDNVTVVDLCINNEGLKVMADECDDIIFAWGDFKIIKQTGRDKELIELFPNAKCFGKSKSGSPLHPLAMSQRNGRDPNNPTLSNYSTGSTCI